MIEVNLLPGGKKRASKGFSFAMPKLSSLGGGGGDAGDRYMMFFGVAAAIAIGYMGFTFMGASSEREELGVRLEEERQDSIRFAALIEQTNRLTARRDSIAERVNIIQEIDAGRFVWPHLLDEVAAAVPEYTWLSEITYANASPLQVRIVGRAGSIYSVTQFMRRLESSAFLRDADVQTIQQQPSENDPTDLVQVFELLVTYESPPLDELQTVPLFDEESSAQSAAPGGN
ncbi:MAG: PilN domain-containing protein [Gemmatimonadota bacterium]|nr:PilN domain-containing protein [Gemmatimonadota bacterium]MDH3423291.1 PilN domain-containing protein [Gemmatimonadota bacterium]